MLFRILRLTVLHQETLRRLTVLHPEILRRQLEIHHPATLPRKVATLAKMITKYFLGFK